LSSLTLHRIAIGPSAVALREGRRRRDGATGTTAAILLLTHSEGQISVPAEVRTRTIHAQINVHPTTSGAEFHGRINCRQGRNGHRDSKGDGVQVKSEQGAVCVSEVQIVTCSNLRSASPSRFQGGAFAIVTLSPVKRQSRSALQATIKAVRCIRPANRLQFGNAN
jgi:hypothetical protein